MFSRMLVPSAVQNGKSFSTTSKNNFKVMIAGASGGIGQPLALLLKMYPLVTQLAMYDISPATPGVTEDLHHVNTPSKVKAYMGAKNLSAAVKDAHVVVIPAGTPSKPGMNRDELFGVNSSIVRDLAMSIAKNSPKAIVAIITNPVNSMVPVCSEVLKKAGVYDPRRVFGVTTLDVVRASVFVGEINGVDPSTVSVPIIGGHSGVTIIPVLSQSKPLVKIIKDQAKVKELTKKIQEAGPQVVIAKAGTGSSTLSMAYAAARLTNSILRGLNGESNVVECTYVKSDLTVSPYFASPILLGKNGVEKQLGYGKLNAYEQELLKIAIPALLKNIKTAEDYIKKHG